MKANELMVGDRVTHFYDGRNCVVTELREHKIAVSFIDADYKKKYSELLPEMAFEPIELTDEILEKNGFKCEEIIQPHWVSDDGRILLRNDESLINSNNKWSVHIDTEDMRTMGYFEITYVHELQHCLRFCNIEKEIII